MTESTNDKKGSYELDPIRVVREIEPKVSWFRRQDSGVDRLFGQVVFHGIEVGSWGLSPILWIHISPEREKRAKLDIDGGNAGGRALAKHVECESEEAARGIAETFARELWQSFMVEGRRTAHERNSSE